MVAKTASNIVQKVRQNTMYYKLIEFTLNRKVPNVLAKIILQFIKVEPKPWFPLDTPSLSPWDHLMEPSDGIELPMFAP